MKKLLKFLSFRARSFFYPDYCFDCGAVVEPGEEFCSLCVQLTLEEKVPPMIESQSGAVSNYYSCFSFEEPLIRKVVHAVKYEAFPAPALALLEKRLPELELGDFDAVVPIPLHRKRRNWRGYNQAELMAKRLGVLINRPVMDPLKRVKHTTTQTRKKRWERKGAMKEVFSLKNGVDLNGKNVLLVDDVATTGATAGECAKLLLERGVRTVSLLTLARA